jgi:hypothetical protein
VKGRGAQVPIGILFWVLMVLWFLFGMYWNGVPSQANAGIWGGNLLLFILLFLLGWKAFGFVIQGG